MTQDADTTSGPEEKEEAEEATVQEEAKEKDDDEDEEGILQKPYKPSIWGFPSFWESLE